jgi:cytochrome c oxidase cbb3-type subunit 2
MNSGPLIFLGAFFTLATSFWGLILVPQLQIGRQEQVKLEATGQYYPANRPGEAMQGAEVYRDLGCVECHTQQVRPRGQGADFERGWGQRRSVAQDYVREYPVLVGSQRVGPDLSNIGAREPDGIQQLKRLYDPRSIRPGSMMPPHRFLFEKRRLGPGQKPGPEALLVEGVDPAYEIVPKPEASALVFYLLSLRSDIPLFEAPLPLPPRTNAPPGAAGSTNAPVANSATNAPATNAAPAPPTP